MRAIICDIDGSLMVNSGGLFVSDRVRDKIVEIEKSGVIVILNSARSFMGVLPLAKQLEMDHFGGYIISENGSLIYDVKNDRVLRDICIDEKDALAFWNLCLDFGLIPAISQPEYMIAYDFCEGYFLDRQNCDLDYIITHDPNKYIKGPIWKCSFAGKSDLMVHVFDSLSKQTKLHALLSTSLMGDAICVGVDKVSACDWLLHNLSIAWDDVSVIGDGNIDVDCIKRSGFGVTLENGSELCKLNSDMIVPSCLVDGCLTWLDLLICEKI